MDTVGVYNWIMFAENNSGGATVWLQTCDQEVASSIPGRARLRTTTLGKLFTPKCLDDDTLR